MIDLLRDLAEPLGGVTIKRMFGGLGLMRDGRMFGLVSRDVLYFKVDDQTRGAYEAAGLEPFSYGSKSGERMLANYRRAPEAVFDDPAEFADWARPAIAVAMRAGEKAKKRKSGRKRAGGEIDFP